MKKKYFISLLLVLSMLVPTVMPVSAAVADAQILGGYTLAGWSELISPEDKGVRVGPTDFAARTGNYSLCGIFPTIKTYQHDCIRNNLQTVTLEGGRTYTFGVWLKFDDEYKVSKSWPYICVAGNYTDNWDLAPKAGEGKIDGWRHYTKTFTPSSSVTGNLEFGFDANLGADNTSPTGTITILFDDIYMCESGSDVNLIDNPSFESYLTQPIKVKDPNGTLKPYGWGTFTESSSQATDFYVQAVNDPEAAHSGNQAMYVHRGGSGSLGDRVRGTATSDSSMPAGTYKITVYVRGKMTKGQNIIGISGFTADEYWLDHFTATYEGNGWTKYEKTITTTAATSNLIYQIGSGGYNQSYYVDDLSIVNTATGKNYFVNGDFENCYTYDGNEPTRFVAYSASNANADKAVVAWQNPNRDDITAITLSVNGNAASFTPVLTAIGYNQVVLTGLTNYTTYNCELAITAGGETRTYSRSFIQNSSARNYNAAGNLPLLSWRFSRNESSGNYTKGVLAIDNDVKYSGNSSMRITCGTAPDGEVTDVYSRLYQNVTLKKNARYRFTAAVKCVGLDDGIEVFVNNWTRVTGTPTNSTGWEIISGVIAANDSTAADDETWTTNIAFHIYEGGDLAWIDDVTLKELDGDNEFGENLIKNGDFEYGEWAVSGYSFNRTSDGNSVSSLEAGEIQGKINVFNFSKANFNAVAATALYKDGDLIGSSFVSPTNIPIMTNPFSPTQLGGSVTVPNTLGTGVYEMKVFLWDSFTNTAALAKPGVLTE